jgi:heterodisulfide reductase subunit A
MDKCIACGACVEKCPKKVPDEYNEGLIKRKAVYVKYAQAVPLKYAIDDRFCIKLTKGKCGNCEKICPTGAINYEDKERELRLNVGAVILADGSEAYDPSEHDTFGYGSNPNIVTSLEFERLLSASGPYGGHLIRPSDKEEPEKIAWLQCIGSRDESLGARGYCSSVCCTYAIKEAMLAKEHCNGNLDAAVFYMDIRTTGKDFERYYNRAKEQDGIRFIKSKITHIESSNGQCLLRYVDEEGKRVDEKFDIVVLSVGLGANRKAGSLAETLGVELDPYKFVNTSSFSPVRSSVPGIYVCGAHQAPKDIPSSVVDSSAAAAEVARSLFESRWSLTNVPVVPEERDIRGEPPRIGVFVCCCGTNIAGTVDVDRVVEYSKTLPGVAYAEKNLFSCSQDTQDKMSQLIREKGLNRVVVAACTPKTHEPLFHETMKNAGLSKYLFEMANIRNQCSWVHRDEPEAATNKAIDLVSMAVSKACILEPLSEPVLEVDQRALVIGGGIAGMEAASNLAGQGFRTYLVEKSKSLGGNGLSLRESWRGEDIQAYLNDLIDKVNSNENIKVFLDAVITEVEGFVGNFKTMIKQGRESRMVEHGVTIIATGARELQPSENGYPNHPSIITGLELQRRFINDDNEFEGIKSVVFLQCFGSRTPERPYCSKVCCTQSIESAMRLKKLNPSMKVFVAYRDMRTYGLRENLYREARMAGISFLRYNEDKGFEVSVEGEGLKAEFTDTVLKRRMEIKPDLLVLASAIIPDKDAQLAQFYKVSRNDDGFFAEAHVKLRPVDFSTDGVFVCGLAHSPKPVDESIAQAQAAAARASTLLSAKQIPVSGTVAYVNPDLCSMCGVCLSVCPYSAPAINKDIGKVEIQSTLCKGCGLCTASCRSGAAQLKGFENSQILAMIEDAA